MIFSELQKEFGSIDRCIAYFKRHNIIYEESSCPRCSSPMYPAKKRGTEIFRCVNRTCKNTRSIFYGTILYKARDPFAVMQIIFLWINKTPPTSIARQTGLDNKMVQRYLSLINFVISSSLEEGDTKIGGEGIRVQIDESKFGRRKYNRGRRVEGAWVVGGIEETPERKVFLKIVERRNIETLNDIINTHVLPGSIIVTDCWAGYGNVSVLDNNYQHETVNHSVTFVDPMTGANTNKIEGTWSGIKQNVPPRKRTKALLEHKLTEYIWRRKAGNELWKNLVDIMRTIHIDFK